MNIFGFGAFRNKMHIPSHDQFLFHMLFGAFHVTPRIHPIIIIFLQPATNITRFFRVVEWVGLNLGYMLLDEFIPIYDELTKHEDYSASVEFIQGTFKFLEKLILQKRSYKSVIIKIGFVQISSKFLSSNIELNQLICTTTRDGVFKRAASSRWSSSLYCPHAAFGRNDH